MPLLTLDKASLQYGTQVLMDEVDLKIEKGDRIGLLGRNGVGKSTLLKIIAGSIELDSGERWERGGTSIAYLDQSLPAADDQDVYDVVAHGLADIGDLLAQYHHCIVDNDMDGLARAQAELEARDGWSLAQKVETTISQLQLPGDARMDTLSGGWRRRVALGRALVSDPDILLLDEPTNHLDIPAIEWLESQLRSYPGTILFITHDRAFLQKVANSILELDRGHLRHWQGDYHGFLQFREQQLAAEEKENALFDKRLAEEEKWIRQGIKARRTRNEGRVRALKAMREERSQRRSKVGSASFRLDDADRSGKRVAELQDVSHGFDGKLVLKNFSTLVSRGDRIGIVGPNGAGKSTLLKVLLGELAPDKGKVKLGTKLEISYFDQLRTQLDPDKDLIDNVCGGHEFIEIDGRRRHAISYLGDFLFGPERVRTPLKALSGGEQNRAILARLFSKPANLLVLDEPTNDLDIETLELLEEILLDFDGTVLLVSHDRAFMDNVVTSLLVLDGSGHIDEQAGGYSDWLDRGGKLPGLDTPASQESATAPDLPGKSTKANAPAEQTAAVKKLSYKEQRELDALPDQIDELENLQASLEEKISDPDFYQQEHAITSATLEQLAQVSQELDQAMERWTELSDRG